MRRTLVILGAFLLGTSASTLSAQAPAAAPAKRTVISVQPLSAIFSVYAVELEHATSPTTTWGLGGTYWSPNFAGEDMTYTSGDIKWRYYPQGHALEGFSFGLSGGYTYIKDKQTDVYFGTGTYNEYTTSGPTIGATLEYNWLLGHEKGFFIGLGAGAKRIFAKSDDMSTDVKFGYPTARISIGKAF
jgi:hypothetical protein